MHTLLSQANLICAADAENFFFIQAKIKAVNQLCDGFLEI